MNTSASSVIITAFLWYILLGLYNLAFLSIFKKIQELDWKKFILETVGVLASYIIVTVLSLQIAGNVPMSLFVTINMALLFGVGYLYSNKVMKLESKNSLIYAFAFMAVFNLYWYSLAGIL